MGERCNAGDILRPSDVHYIVRHHLVHLATSISARTSSAIASSGINSISASSSTSGSSSSSSSGTRTSTTSSTSTSTSINPVSAAAATAAAASPGLFVPSPQLVYYIDASAPSPIREALVEVRVDTLP